MNNKQAIDFLFANNSNISQTVHSFLQIHELPQSEFSSYRYKFTKLVDLRKKSIKNKDLHVWEQAPFYEGIPLTNFESLSIDSSPSDDDYVFVEDLHRDRRKSLTELSLRQAKTRLNNLLMHIRALANLEHISPKSLTTYALHLLANEEKDYNTASICKNLEHGAFNTSKVLSLDKASYLLDMLEIGRRKYTEMRRLCLTENILFPSYGKLAKHRCDIGLVNDFVFIEHEKYSVPIGLAISYRKIVIQTTNRLLANIPDLGHCTFPLKLVISDGLDGSGCHRIYNQLPLHPEISTKSFILFGFKIISMTDSSNPPEIHWINPMPNSPFVLRPVALLSLEENRENVRFIMERIINQETEILEKEGIILDQIPVEIKIIRSMVDGKMAKLCDGAGGAACQLCTATKFNLKDTYFIRNGFPINRTIQSAKQIFEEVDVGDFLSLPSDQRFGITERFTSHHDILPASPLHSYLRVFSWFMNLIYHLHADHKNEWSPSHPDVESSKRFIQEYLREHTGIRIDYPNAQGGTSTTGNVARTCFIRHKENQHDFLTSILTILKENDHDYIITLHENLAVILRVMNCSQKIDIPQLDFHCKFTYEFIVCKYPWANVTPTLHKVLAHTVDLISDYNNGHGLKCLSEEALEGCNKYVRKFRENLSRKTSFQDNLRDVIVRLERLSDYGYLSIRYKCQNKERILKNTTNAMSGQDKLFSNLIIET